MLYLLVALGFMFFAGVAMTVNEGLWNNTILLLCILISGCASVAAGVPVGMLIFDQIGLAADKAWYCTFAGMWAVFVVAMLLLRIVAERASKIRVRFLPLVDKIGGILMGLLVAYMLTSFATNTLLDAPIRAGAWKKKDASAGQLQVYGQLGAPFNMVAKNFADTEGFRTIGK